MQCKKFVEKKQTINVLFRKIFGPFLLILCIIFAPPIFWNKQCKGSFSLLKMFVQTQNVFPLLQHVEEIIIRIVYNRGIGLKTPADFMFNLELESC